MEIPAPDPHAQECVDYMNASWTAYHAVLNCKIVLL